jgi:hypothetical protein
MSDAVENLPAKHTVQMLAPAPAPVLVIEPATHSAQSFSSSEPIVSTYLPGSQSVQAPTFDAVENLPTAHAVQLLPPALMPVLVMEPAAHLAQEAAVDIVEYLPAVHSVHKRPPTAPPVSVIDPATHTLQ